MHILELYIESGGYDYKLIKGGISVYLWNLTRAFNERGHQTSVVSAMNGKQSYLEHQHGLEKLDYEHDWTLELDADPAIWGNDKPIALPLKTSAYRLRKDNTDFYYLSNEYLDLYPDTYYPPYESKGEQLGFFKPLIFQVEAIAFIQDYFKQQELLIHAHEPYYQYLVPAAFADDNAKRVVSTVQSNMPITKKVYAPKVASLLAQLDIDLDVTPYQDLAESSLFNRCLTQYLPRTHLSYPYADDYIAFYNLLLDTSDGVDFLSDGHLEFYTYFHGTAFRALFTQLDVSRLVERHKNKLFVGGCALSDSWIEQDFSQFDRSDLLSNLGLNPALPTFFHNARYAPNHKGQVEMILAIRRCLEQGVDANFILRCISGTGIPDQRFHDLVADFPDRVCLIWEMQSEDALMAMAAAADFALFPSKFEMDTFLIAHGEAMLAGCVPIASDQLGMEHWCHGAAYENGEQRTGFNVVRSFLEEDPQLIESLELAINKACDLFADQPAYEAMSLKSRNTALTYDWQRAADLHLQGFERVMQGESPAQRDDQTSDTGTDWLTEARDLGQIIDRRAHGESDVPSISWHNHTLQYELADAVAIRFFQINGNHFDDVDGQVDSKRGVLSIATPDVPGYLLITRSNGDQYWDAYRATREHVV